VTERRIRPLQGDGVAGVDVVDPTEGRPEGRPVPGDAHRLPEARHLGLLVVGRPAREAGGPAGAWGAPRLAPDARDLDPPEGLALLEAPREPAGVARGGGAREVGLDCGWR